MRKIAWWACVVLTMSLPAVAQQVEWNPDKAAEDARLPVHPVTAAQVHQLLVLTNSDNLKKQMMNGMTPYLRQAMPFLPADVMDDFQARMEKADLEPMAVESYQKHLSTEDATQLIAFYETPAGKRVIAAMPLILRETQQAGAQLGQQVMKDTMEAHKAEIEAAIQKYKQQHSGAAAQH